MSRAPVNKIIHSSVVDGPGNRTAVFLQGCNLRCAYCHNPETQNLCNSCGVCLAVCPGGALSLSAEGRVVWNEEKCVGCDACIAACPNRASPKVKWSSAEEVFVQIEKNLPFIRGITVSGGECSLYPDFLTELFRLSKAAGLSCLMDSNGMVELSAFPELIAVCDGVMLDVKAWDTGIHRQLTGEENGPVKRNLAFLAKAGKLTEVRHVCVPGRADVKAVLEGVAQTLGPEETAETPLKLISFRPFGVRGELSDMPQPPRVWMEELLREARGLGFKRARLI